MQPLPGFRDFLPADCAERNYIFRQWREVARRYGFVEWEGPVLEPTELYRKKSGPEIVEQLFHFTDKGEREVALRPELTPTLARVVAAHEREFKKPLKWFSIGQFFRYEKQQRGRLREHFQLNCDIIGESFLGADVELLALCIDLLRSFGLTHSDFVIRVSDREFWMDFLRRHQVAEERLQEILQIIDKSEREPREKTAEKLGLLAEPVFAVLAGEGKSDRLDQVRRGLETRGLAEFVQIDLGIVRGLAYYTGIVFEAFDRGGKFRAICGGGRYDHLIEQLSNAAVRMPAAGFAMGDVVLGELLRDREEPRKKMQEMARACQTIGVYAVIAKEGRRDDALREIQALRDAGYTVDYSLSEMKVSRQFQSAEQLGAAVAIVFGDEWPQIAVKNLATGEQQLVPKEDLLSRIKSMLR